MDSYADIIGLSSQALMSSMIWGVTYFIVLLAPLYIYLSTFFSKDEINRATPFHEIAGQALVIQIGALIMFAILGSFLSNINIGNSDLKPEKAFKVFFGSGSELIDERWSGYLTSLSGDSASLTTFGNEAKGVAFLANKYIGIVYRIFILFIFFSLLFYTIASLTRKFRDGEQQINLFTRIYQTFVSVVFFVLLVGMHGAIAKTLPTFFGVPTDTVSVDFIKYFQKVVSSTFYGTATTTAP